MSAHAAVDAHDSRLVPADSPLRAGRKTKRIKAVLAEDGKVGARRFLMKHLDARGIRTRVITAGACFLALSATVAQLWIEYHPGHAFREQLAFPECPAQRGGRLDLHRGRQSTVAPVARSRFGQVPRAWGCLSLCGEIHAVTPCDQLLFRTYASLLQAGQSLR